MGEIVNKDCESVEKIEKLDFFYLNRGKLVHKHG